MLRDTTTRWQRMALRAALNRVAAHPGAVVDRAQLGRADHSADFRVHGTDAGDTVRLVAELAADLHLRAPRLNGDFLFAKSRSGLTMVAARMPVRQCGACGNWPCTCAKPSPAPGTGGKGAPR